MALTVEIKNKTYYMGRKYKSKFLLSIFQETSEPRLLQPKPGQKITAVEFGEVEGYTARSIYSFPAKKIQHTQSGEWWDNLTPQDWCCAWKGIEFISNRPTPLIILQKNEDFALVKIDNEDPFVIKKQAITTFDPYCTINEYLRWRKSAQAGVPLADVKKMIAKL